VRRSPQRNRPAIFIFVRVSTELERVARAQLTARADGQEPAQQVLREAERVCTVKTAREQHERRGAGPVWMLVHGEQGRERAEENVRPMPQGRSSADPGVDSLTLLRRVHRLRLSPLSAVSTEPSVCPCLP
jgi:hypothetical protein